MTQQGSHPFPDKVVFDNARFWHEDWKRKLRDAVISKQTIDQTSVERDDCCELGQWIYSDGRRQFGHKPEFQSLLLNHKEFHMLAGAVAEVVNSQEFALAEAYLSEDTQLAQASREVNDSLSRLQRAVVG